MANILTETAGALETNYNRLPFQFSRNLKTDARFQMPAPRWVQNYDNTSIFLGINFELKPVFDHARVLCVNRWLRKLGLPVTEPGLSPLADRLKLAGARVAVRIRDKIKLSPFRLWTPRSISTRKRGWSYTAAILKRFR